MEQHIARRTTASAKPSPLSPPHHQSRRQSRQNSALLHPQKQSQRHSSSTDRSSSRHHDEVTPTTKTKTKTSNRPTPTQQLAPAVTSAERAIGKGASLPVVDEKGQVWYDWEEKQEFTPLITVEHERSGWVNFPGATGRSSSITSSSGDEGGDGGCDSTSASPIRPAFPLSFPLPLHTVLDAFTFAGDGAGAGAGPGTGTGGGGGGGGGGAPAAVTVDPKDPLHGLQMPPGTRPRGKDRRIVRRVDSLPSLLDQAEQKEAAAREFFDASFDPVQAMRMMQQQQQQPRQQQDATAATAATEEASTAENKQLAFSKRASMSMKGFKKIFSRKKSTSA